MARPIKHRGKWRIRWFDEHGRRQSEVCDDHRAALSRLREREHEVEEIRRGLRSAIVPDKSFADLCQYWLTRRAVLKRSRKDDESVIRRHLRPAFGHLRVREFATPKGVEAIDQFIVDRAGLNKKTIANLLTLLISMLNVAVELCWLHKAPRIRKPRIRLFDRDFAYLRTDEEVRRFLEAARDEGDNVFVLYAAAIYTGMREGELAALTREDIDLERRLITVQRSFDGPTKAEDVRYVPILDPLLPVLRSWLLRNPGRIVFPNQAGRMHCRSARVFQETLHRVLDRAGFPRRQSGRRRYYICFHSLRHSFASHWMMKGGDIFKLSKILGHKSIQMTQRYAHLSPAAFEGDYGRLGGKDELDRGTLIELPVAVGGGRPD